jgi:hypothetical protein
VYSKSGTNPDYPPLAAAFGKIDPYGPNDLTNTYLNIHPNCLHSLMKYTTIGKSDKEIQRDKDFSSFEKNPITHDPRTKKQIAAYREKERNRRRYIDDYKQWRKYKAAFGKDIPDFETFREHKLKNDEKYKEWLHNFRSFRAKSSFKMTQSEKMFNNIPPIKNTKGEIQGLIKYAEDRGIKVPFNTKLNANIDLAKEQIDTLAKLREEYKVDSGLTVIFKGMKPSDFGETYKTGNIAINTMALRDRESTIKYLTENNRLSSNDITGIAAHEFAHHLIIRKNINADPVDLLREAYYNIGVDIKDNKDLAAHIKKDLSLYAYENIETELMPELFGKHYTNPSRLTEAFIVLLKGRMGL